MTKLNILEGVRLAPYTTFGIGGDAEYFAKANSEEELEALIAYGNERSLPITIIGGGSNILVNDDGVKGLVIKNCIPGIEYQSEGELVYATAGAGVEWDELVYDTVKQGYWGLENLSAIPGSVGATPVQNVGAYGVEVSDLIHSVRVYDKSASEFFSLNKEDCKFGYRDSIFKTVVGKRYVIVAVTYVLSSIPAPKLHYKDLQERFLNADKVPTLEEIRMAITDVRSKKFPDWRVVGTAGSFFKNPLVKSGEYLALTEKYFGMPGFKTANGMIKIPLGWILDKVCDLRGYREGSVGTYENQSLVIINHGGADSHEVERFAKKISKKVFDKTNINIEWEVTKI